MLGLTKKMTRVTPPKDQILSIKDYFTPPKLDFERDFIFAAETIQKAAGIENHPFFTFAKKEKRALTIWAAQEAVVTNPFSQILFHVIGSIKNVHIRSILLPVVEGEHSRLRNGIAEHSHPWLIWRLCNSMGIGESDIQPTGAVIEFIQTLEDLTGGLMCALGALGIGNERMLLDEYSAVYNCFEVAYPEAAYRDFLRANIDEDSGHTKLIETAAAALAATGHDPEEFIRGAELGVSARVRYYDELLSEVQRSIKPS
jgi:hypothetical protein